jgi:hypothetical protein
MGQSPTAKLCYGISFPEEEHEFPWGGDSLDDWWRAMNGYTASYPDWEDKAAATAWREEKEAFDLAHPCPVEDVIHCSYDYSYYILAVPGTLRQVDWGETLVVDPASLTVEPEKVAALKNFCAKAGIEIPEESDEGWLLSTIYG